MAEYIYLPVPTKEMTVIAKKMVAARKKHNRPEPGILRNYFVSGFLKGVMHLLGGCLRCVHHSDTLFLMLHGAGVAGSRFIGEKRGRDNKTYTPDQIARTLEKEGLPKSFVDLHLLTCGSGLEGGDKAEYRAPFAKRVSTALKALGYDRIRVTGYLGDIRPGARDGFEVDVLMEEGYTEQFDDTACVTVL
jgi:hypothetical protein